MEYLIFVNGFWGGFEDKIDPNHIGFFQDLFLSTKIKNFEFTNNLENANVLFESVFANSLVKHKNWKYKIHFSGEPTIYPADNYDIVLHSQHTHSNIIDLPLFVSYTYTHNFFDRLLFRPFVNTIPPKFCCFIVSNFKSEPRKKMFEILNCYRKVDSCGKYANNIDFIVPWHHSSQEYLQFISQYKFIICFENSSKDHYITEKIINAYIAGVIPIYWSSHYVKNIFNSDSMLFLEDASNNSCYEYIINRVMELDMDDDAYLDMINKPILKSPDFWDEMYSIESLSEKLNRFL